MQFDYKQFRVDASPLDEGGHYYARAKIYLRASVAGEKAEVKYSGDLGDYPSDTDAFEAAQRWAIQWCDENSAYNRLRAMIPRNQEWRRPRGNARTAPLS